MRGRISGVKSYAKGVDPGRPDGGRHGRRGAGIEAPRLQGGRLVQGYDGWQTHGDVEGRRASASSIPAQAPISTALGVLGMPGMTAYVGLLDIGQPKPGETVVVSAASGAVGAVVGQIAKIKGCRAVGIAGAQGQVRVRRERAGVRRVRRLQDRRRLATALAGRLPQGHRRLLRERRRRRCSRRCCSSSTRSRASRSAGSISQYNATEMPAGPNWRRAAREPRAREGLHRVGSPRPHARLPARTSAGGCARAGSSTARTSSTASRTRRPRSSGSCRARTSAR